MVQGALSSTHVVPLLVQGALSSTHVVPLQVQGALSSTHVVPLLLVQGALSSTHVVPQQNGFSESHYSSKDCYHNNLLEYLSVFKTLKETIIPQHSILSCALGILLYYMRISSIYTYIHIRNICIYCLYVIIIIGLHRSIYICTFKFCSWIQSPMLAPSTMFFEFIMYSAAVINVNCLCT